jgi:hypothetical protein
VSRGGEGVQSRDDELADPGCCVETGGEASEDSGVEGFFDAELLTESGDEVSSVWLPFLPFGRRGCKPVSPFERCVCFERAEPPLQAMQNVPGTYTVDVIGDGRSGVGTGQADDEGSDGGLVGWSSLLFWDAPCVAEYVVYEDTGAVRLSRGLCPSVRHDIVDSLQLSGAQLSQDVAAADIRGWSPPPEPVSGQAVWAEGGGLRAEVWAVSGRLGSTGGARKGGERSLAWDWDAVPNAVGGG